MARFSPHGMKMPVATGILTFRADLRIFLMHFCRTIHILKRLELFDLTKALVAIASPTGNEQGVTSFLHDYLRDAGFLVDLQEVADERFNVYARVGDPVVVFSTHTDTVSPFVAVKESDGFIHGRGACDAKGIIAAQIKAAERLLSDGLEDLGLLFVVGEERGSDGARAANGVPNRCRFLINGEPTENKLAIASKGVLRVAVTTTGRAAHSARPEQGKSAILKLLDILADLRGLAYPRHDDLGGTIFNIGTIAGGTQANVVPDHASAELMFRTVTECSVMKNLLETAVGERAEVRSLFESDPVFFEVLEGFETTVVSFATDVPLLTNWGRPLLLGPGSILEAHGPDERIAKKDLTRAVNLYCRMVETLMCRV